MCDESYFEIGSYGAKRYYKNGTKSRQCIYHRTDGPAIEYANGDKRWFINGKKYSKKDYYKLIKLKAFI